MESKKQIRLPSVYDELTNDELKALSEWKQSLAYKVLLKLLKAKRNNNLNKLLLTEVNNDTLFILAQIQGANTENAAILSIPATSEKMLKDRLENNMEGKYKELYKRKKVL